MSVCLSVRLSVCALSERQRAVRNLPKVLLTGERCCLSVGQPTVDDHDLNVTARLLRSL